MKLQQLRQRFERSLDKVKQRVASKFVRNLGWLGGSQMLIRVFRLGTTVVTARLLTEEDFGLVAIALTIHQFVLVFTANGLEEKLSQAKDEDVDVYCQTIYWLNWILSGLLFVAQCLIAFPLAWFYDNNRLILPICILALTYLVRANCTVQAGLVQRDNNLRVFAISDAVGNMATNIVCIVMALLGWGIWAIVIPQVLLSPIWVIIINKSHPWRPSRKFSLHRWQEIAGFGKNILGIGLLSTLRGNIDYLIVGKFLDLQQLGTYYFAFNAGIGISLNLVNTFNTALFPHLCTARGDVDRLKQYYFDSLKTMAAIAIPLILLQTSLAPVYVPIVFGDKWVHAIPVLMLICLSALPRPFADAASRLLWATDEPHVDLYWNGVFTLVLTIAVLIGLQFGIIGVAIAVLLAHWAAMPIFTLWATRRALRRQAALLALTDRE